MNEHRVPTDIGVVLNDDATTASIVIPAGTDPGLVTPELLGSLARERGIGLDDRSTALLGQIAGEFRDDPRALDRVFARSTPARMGANGRFEFEAKFDPALHAAPDDTSMDPVNHYERRAYLRVARDERIGTLWPPTKGVDGRDLTGRILRATDGRPCPIRFDKALVLATDGSVRSPCDGILSTDGAQVRVSPVFDVPVSVDFSTGNIEFAGSVHVRADIRDKFRVDVGENLVVEGVIEAASIRCGGGLHARIGMAGRGMGRVLVRSDAQAGYLSAVSGAVHGSLIVQREVRNCSLIVGGDLVIPRGAVIGGALSVSGGMDAGTLGSPSGTPTTITLGAVPFLDNSARKLARRMEALRAQLDATLPHLEVLARATMKLSAADEARRAALTDKIAKLGDEQRELTAELDRVRRLIASGGNVKLRVNSVIYPNVRLLIDDHIVTFIQECKGPVHIGVDLERRPVLRIGEGPIRSMDLYARSITVERASPHDQADRPAA